MNYEEERQKINIAVAQYESKLKAKVFEEFFKTEKEQELMIYETTFDDRGNLFGYKRMMWQKFNKKEIMEEMQNPAYFFQHGWFFPENKTKEEIDVISGKKQVAYHLHTSIPPKFFQQADFMVALLNCFSKFWDTFNIENCKKYDIEALKFGYKNGIITMQLKAMEELKKIYDILTQESSSSEENNKIEIVKEQVEVLNNLNKLSKMPLFKTDKYTSEKLYKKYSLGIYNNLDKEVNYDK